MTVSRCESSLIMTELLAWRNSSPQASVTTRAIKRGITEIGLFYLASTAAIETVAYAALATVSAAFIPISKKPFHFFSKKIESSSFTFIWAVSNALFYNIFKRQLVEHESIARLITADNFFVTAFIRNEDLSYSRSIFPPALLRKFRCIDQQIQSGSDFLKNEVFADLHKRDKDRVREISFEIIPFILARSVYTFSCGTMKTQTLPLFFKSNTIRAIAGLRKKTDSLTQPQKERLKAAFESLEHFEEDIEEPRLQEIFQDIKTASCLELQSSFFSSSCLQQAIMTLPIDPVDQLASENTPLTSESVDNNDC